ncbi:MAG: endo-1,4-beta-xylanase [Actinomycetota bacterium]|nr:endo-1,4-beta-xylanase [Actinomycetota bacterium]
MVRNRTKLTSAAIGLAGIAFLATACSSGSPEPESPTATAAATEAVPPANAVPATLVGMHIEGAEAGAWASAPFGALRLWDNGTAWSQIELEPGVYKWDNLEGILENAESKGMTDILMVLGTTPEWNAKVVNPDDYPQPGAASAPKDLDAWDSWVTEVATRYKGRITSYQIWNEANLKNFWGGTPEEMAELTKRAYDIIKAIDPAALVVSASPSTRLTASFDRFFPAYLKALADKGWPIDVVGFHTYPGADGDPVARGALIEATKTALTAAGAPELPLWDTELNYGLAGPGPDLAKQDITGVDAAGWIVRTYIDDLRYGVARSYWYIWTQKPYALLGIQAYPGSDGEQGFFALDTWVVGAGFDGCTEAEGVVECTFTRDATPSVIVWAESGSATYTAPDNAALACDPLANCQRVEPGSQIALTDVPVRIFAQA